MESVEMTTLFGGIYRGKKVLVTGHTGFKGSWLAYWLKLMGAEVFGIALDPPTVPNHFSLLGDICTSFILDINKKEAFESVVAEISPEIIFHLAAQPIVRLSYEQPFETFQTNILGTVNVLDAARKSESVRAVVIVTSDKCYENREWVWGYRENDPMGGRDPYSASKGCAELVTAAYRASFFTATGNNMSRVLVASARAGNVIGGGDWAADRIVPDLVKAASEQRTVYLRYPMATRPWQHVLEPLSGYLALGRQLLSAETRFAKGWNFGPGTASNLPVIRLVEEAKKSWSAIREEVNTEKQPHEAGFLMLDSALAHRELKWEPVWGFAETIQRTINWYRIYYETGDVCTRSDLKAFVNAAFDKKLFWTHSEP